MKYLCLIYDEEKTLAGMSKADSDAFMGEYFAFTENIKKSGHYVGGEALKPVHTATTVRIRNGKTSTTDGPFAETKEQLGGYYLIDAADLNEALQIAAKIPSARTGRGVRLAIQASARGRRLTPSTAPTRGGCSRR
jgi:hypothetical protein